MWLYQGRGVCFRRKPVGKTTQVQPKTRLCSPLLRSLLVALDELSVLGPMLETDSARWLLSKTQLHVSGLDL